MPSHNMEEQIHEDRKQNPYLHVYNLAEIATYAAETRTETAKTKSMLRIMEVKTLRLILGISI